MDVTIVMIIVKESSLTAQLLDLEHAGRTMDGISMANTSSKTPNRSYNGADHAATGMIPDGRHYSDDNLNSEGKLTYGTSTRSTSRASWNFEIEQVEKYLIQLFFSDMRNRVYNDDAMMK
jgi:hypothetical protein